MIVPMLKYSFLVHHAEYKQFLKQLKRLGVLHIHTKENELTAEMQDMFRAINDLSATISSLKKRTKKKEQSDYKNPQFKGGEEALTAVRNTETEIEQKQQQLSVLEKEAQQLSPWGDFSPETLTALQKEGIHIRFLICREKEYSPQWEKEFFIERINIQESFQYFVVIHDDNTDISPLLELPAVDELYLPQKALSNVFKQQEELNADIEKLNKQLDAIAFYGTEQLQAYQNKLQAALDDSNAILQTKSEAEEHVMLIEGWVPKIKTEELNHYLEDNSILHISEKPNDEESVPVLLKNNRFTRVFETIGGLYELPNHKEMDLTPFFAPFYMMFFGFSLGDAGYGLVIVLAAFYMKFKFPELRSILTLAQWLGLATVIFGALTGTFFGIDLINSEIPWLENVKRYMIDIDTMFNLAIVLGVIQILFGMVLKVINISISKGFSYSYATIGWLILLVGSGLIFFLGQAEAIGTATAKYVQNGVLIISGVLILLLNNPKQNIFMNFLTGLWDVYSMVTGLVGDVLSYIRLFALGVSSAILGFVFNELAMSLSPDIPILGPVIMIIILLFGHGMTIFMAGLGAFVHPIRLTFVEFYKNAGFVGGGKRYTPFSEKNEK